MLHLRFVCALAFPLLLVLLLLSQPAEGFILRLITETLQNNVAGEPITHDRTEWNFDPNAAKNARALYFEKNGFRSSKFIERLGAGTDGWHEERRMEQAVRDVGRLGGEHNQNYPPPPV
ncbi:uncharacterized protein LOC117583330 [Drosophila guanche]|uniref:Uncharacterized protein n=1 Tax=Drosophila guanche TaxID=7266 RepID=A0A3B0J3G3_DROGU|nr:uncharacterized protein LOC117583330 [Drosophila guanche]SPP73782.1 Hypothetical predicted protein [Drosophila guanche]